MKMRHTLPATLAIALAALALGAAHSSVALAAQSEELREAAREARWVADGTTGGNGGQDITGLDISDKRLPQDGRFAMKVRGRDVDVRMSTMPVQYGESVVMRLLDQSSGILSLTETGAAYFERCVQILDDLREADAEASATTATARGRLRINAPLTFGNLHLAPLWGLLRPDEDPALTFGELVADCTATLQVVARFLGLLQLYRESAVAFDQPLPLGELTVRWMAPEAGGDAGPSGVDIGAGVVEEEYE